MKRFKAAPVLPSSPPHQAAFVDAPCPTLATSTSLNSQQPCTTKGKGGGSETL